MSSITIAKLQENENSLKELNQEECSIYGGFCFNSSFVWNISAELAPDLGLDATYIETSTSGVDENGNQFCEAAFNLTILYVRQ